MFAPLVSQHLLEEFKTAKRKAKEGEKKSIESSIVEEDAKERGVNFDDEARTSHWLCPACRGKHRAHTRVPGQCKLAGGDEEQEEIDDETVQQAGTAPPTPHGTAQHDTTTQHGTTQVQEVITVQPEGARDVGGVGQPVGRLPLGPPTALGPATTGHGGGAKADGMKHALRAMEEAFDSIDSSCSTVRSVVQSVPGGLALSPGGSPLCGVHSLLCGVPRSLLTLN